MEGRNGTWNKAEVRAARQGAFLTLTKMSVTHPQYDLLGKLRLIYDITDRKPNGYPIK